MLKRLQTQPRRQAKVEKPLPGLYHYISPPDDPRNYRLHLRLEEDGRGVLIANAATVLHLNETAAEYAYYFVHNLPADQVARRMAQRYRVSKDQAQQDYRDFADRILTLIEMPDLDPVTFLDFDRRPPHSGKISAPYRLDVALTYRLPQDADAEAAPLKRVERELATDEWKTVLDKAWKAGIPHVVFTGGEPTLRADLPELIAHAEANGQVSGLLTDGLRLADADYLNTLLATGLDHLLIVLQPGRSAIWVALENALAADVFVAVHLTVTPENSAQADELLRQLANRGVKAVSLSASQPDLSNRLNELRDLSAILGLSLVWDLPVPYSELNPVTLETQTIVGSTGSQPTSLYVEPDGDVLPAQGDTRRLGNLLADPWEVIWKARLAAQPSAMPAR